MAPPRSPQLGPRIAAGQKVKVDRRALAPVAGDLQDRRARQAPVGKQHRLVKALAGAGHPARHRHPGQGLHPPQLLFGKGQGHQGGPGFHQGQAELLGHPVAIARGPHLGDRLAPRGHHHRPRRLRPPRGVDRKARTVPPHLAQCAPKPQGRPRPVQVADQHVDDLGGRPVAEELPQRLFVPSDARGIHPGDEIPLREALQSRQRKARVLRQEPVGRDVQVGKVAPPPARDADLFACRLGMVDDQDPAAPATGLDCGHHAGGPGAKDHGIPDHRRCLPPPRAPGKRLKSRPAPLAACGRLR